MFEAKRTARSLDFKFGENKIKVYLGGLFQYKKFSQSDEKIKALINQAGNNNDEQKTCELIGHAIMDEMECIFGRANSEAILEFYEGNYDEMFINILPFIREEYIPAMVENIKAISHIKINEYK